MFAGTKLFVIAILIYLVWLLHVDTRPKYFSNLFWSLRLYYGVALSLSRSYKIVVCPALEILHPKNVFALEVLDNKTARQVLIFKINWSVFSLF